MDARQLELGADVASRPPVWAVRYLGLPPREEGLLRDDWVRRAGMAAGYRELTGHDDPVEAIGELPATGAAELREAWAAAARALEMPQEESDARAASQGQLEALVRAYERVLAWAPEYVADRLEATSKAAASSRATAQIAEAEAGMSGRARGAQRARRAQAEAEQLDANRKQLAEISAVRDEWLQHTEPARLQANEAAAELARRAHAKAKVMVTVPAGGSGGGPQPEATSKPQSAPALPRTPVIDEELVERARAARERIRAEREAEEASRDPWEREPWQDQAEAEATATWVPGRADPEPGYELEPEGES